MRNDVSKYSRSTSQIPRLEKHPDTHYEESPEIAAGPRDVDT